jgi:4'-phosphopantetheinyl transferase EntD
MWPVGLVGSITHTDGLVMALAVRTSSVSTIGIDAEVRRPLPPEVVDLVLREEEQAEFDDPLQRLALFSAKEAIHKAVFPACGVWLDFRDVRLRLSDGGRAFDVVEASQSAPEMVSELVGRTVMLPGHVFTVCYRVAGGP